MGYTTKFYGNFTFDRPLDEETYTFLVKFSQSRRMKWEVDPEKYGEDGEFFVEYTEEGDNEDDDFYLEHILDDNQPPGTQPSLWCQWIPTYDRLGLIWDGNEKFNYYVEWLNYIIEKITGPRGYVLNGTVKWQGEDEDDIGTIKIENNQVSTTSNEK